MATQWFSNEPLESELDGLNRMGPTKDNFTVSRRRKVIFIVSATVLISLAVLLICLIAAPEVSTLYASPNEVSHEGYDVTQNAYIPEVQAHMVVYRHKTTKTEVLTLIPKDKSQDSVFAISFRTIPHDDTGVAHMLEHSVLDGSEGFPVKDPFNEMERGSLHTFLNAFTFDDRTAYAVASRNSIDFSNLVAVYLDAVFRPLAVTPEGSWILRQEGWRIEETDDGSLQLRGVVMSEMKGVYSDPDELMARYAQKNLFPKTSYRFDSGGDPPKIPTLSHNDFVAFYNKFYHPSNAQIFLYGPIEDVRDGMDQAHSYLTQYEHRSDIRQESRVEWQELELESPVRVSMPYQTSNQDDHRVVITWLVNDRALDSKTEIAWFIVNELLVGTPTSRLEKALKDSGLGDNVIGDGIEFWLQQWTFSVGLQGVSTKAEVDSVNQLIMDTLDTIVVTGFTEDEVVSAMNTVEFSLRELNTGDDPRGLVIFMSTLRSWNYDRDPKEALKFEDAFQSLKDSVKKNGGGIFVSLIRDHLLHNTHRVVTELYPSSSVEENTTRDERIFLEQMKVQVGEHQFANLLKESVELAQVQVTPDSDEALESIPFLSIDDINPTGDEYPINTFIEGGVTVVEHPVEFSFGVLYADFGLDMSVINLDDLALVPLLGRLMLETGTVDLDDVQLAIAIGARTGGMSVEPVVESVLPPRSFQDDTSFIVPKGSMLQTKLFFRGKCTQDKAPDLFSLYRDIVFDGREFDKDKTILTLKETISNLEDTVSADGDLFAARRTAARYTVHGYVNEQLHGITHLAKLKQALEMAESDWGILWAQLDRMKRDLIKGHRNGMILNLSGEGRLLEETQKEALHFVATSIPQNDDATPFPDFTSEQHPWVATALGEMTLLAPIADEGIVAPTSVSYVCRGGILYRPGEEIDGSAAVVTQYLKRGYLYETLRLERGAYGATAVLRTYSGVLDLLTYRDPNLLETLDIYDGIAQALKDDIASSDVLEREALDSIIGAVGALDGSAPQPDQLGWDSLRQYLRNETPEMRQAWRDQILEADRDDFMDFADRLSQMTDASVAVVSSQSALQDAELQGFDFELIGYDGD